MKQHFNIVSSQINAKNKEVDAVTDDVEQISSDITKIKFESINFNQYENLSNKQKVNQNNIEALREMHDKLEDYLAQNHEYNIMNPVKKVKLRAKVSCEEGEPVIKKVIPYMIQCKEPFVKDGKVSLRYSLITNSVLCSVKYNINGSQFVFSNGRTLFYMNSKDGSIEGTCKIPISNNLLIQSLYTRSMCFSPDSRYLALSCPDNKIIIINNISQNIIATFDYHSSIVPTLIFSNNSKYLYSGGYDGKICLWDLNTMKLSKLIHLFSDKYKNINESIVKIAINSSNDFLIVGFNSGRVAFIDLALDHIIKTFSAHQKSLLNICTRNNLKNNVETFLTTSQDKTIKIWESSHSFKCKNTLVGHNDCVITACYSPIDHLILTGSKDETIKCWDEDTGEQLFTLCSHKNTIFQIDHHPSDRSFISCSGDGIICVWDYNISKHHEKPTQMNQ